MDLRPYQVAARDAIIKEWETRNRTLLVLPTGTGKTIVFCSLTRKLVSEGKRVLILAHRAELLDQAADKMQQSTGLRCAVEKAENSSLDEWYRITVGSVQTMMRPSRLAQFERDHYDAIIVDEAHHVLSESYQRILEYFDEAKVLGVTATPDRGDMRNLGQYFESLAYEYTLPAAVRDGYLAKITALTLPLKLDLSGVSVRSGDFRAEEVGTALDPYLGQIAREMAEHCKGRKTVVFLPLIRTSQKMCEMLRAVGFNAAEVNGESKDRAEILADFDAGRYDVLCNSMLLTEGWDCPSVDCIVCLRPTKIRSLYCQIVGRGTRLYPGKSDLLLLDFLWHTTTHQLCRPAHLIAENEEVAKRMTERLEEAGTVLDLEAVEQAAEGDCVQQREEALAKKLADMKHRKKALVDPLQFEMSIQAEDLAAYQPAFGWEVGPASEKQRDALEKYGINPDDVECAGKAAKILDRLAMRRVEGLTTPKQIRFLERLGFGHVGTWQFESAKRMIDRIAANNWRIPHGITPKDYNPNTRTHDTLSSY
jgi:superfamily II DNA or RNA helicase